MRPVARIFWSLVLVCALGYAPSVLAQATTTGTLSGTVIAKEENVALPGASVTAVHLPTGTRYTGQTRGDGRFTLINVRVGGPYTVSVGMAGFRTAEVSDVNVGLGEERVVDFSLELEAITETITVTDEVALIDTTQAGTQTRVTELQIRAVPTLDRSLEDLAKTSIYFSASGGVEGGDPTTISVAGRNNRYNTVQIDGAVNNDLFGLSPTGSPTGQADAQPISLEAIQEVQLVVTPYDVRQGGFSGGGINAITKSGTNDFHGSLFFNTRDNDLVGDGPNDRPFRTFSEDQYGLSLGGPIVADKAFFFIAGELQRKETPTGFSAALSNRQTEANRFISILQNRYGYDPGSADEFTRNTDNDSYFARVDFNVAEAHQLTARYNLVDAENDISNASPTFILTEDRPYNIRPETSALVVQLNSVIGSDMFNEARVGFTKVETIRDGSSRFPTVQVDIPGTSVSLEAGRERFSTANELEQDILEINNDLTFVRSNHTFTVGTHNELFKFRNLFIRDLFGFYNFRSLEDFERGWADQYEHSFSLTGDPLQAAEFDAQQYGLYFGDQWRVKDNLSLTLGLRADYLVLPDEPSFNAQVQTLYGADTSAVPDSNLILSPRIGFNWDMKSDGKQQLRGGIGIFSGRTPYVWISNQYGNTGNEFRRLRATLTPPITATNNIPFQPNPDNQPKTVGGTVTNEVAVTDPDFEMPTVLRANLGYDMELPWGILGTAEVTYSDVQKDIQYRDLNLRRTTRTGLGGRPIYEPISRSFVGVYQLTNTEDGESTTAALQLRNREWKGFSWTAGYLWQDAEEVYPGTSSQASSNLNNTSVFDVQNPGVADATFLTEHRFSGTAAYRFDLGKVGSTVSLYFNRQSGRPYSTTFGSGGADVNGDGVRGNDLLYVPRDRTEVPVVRVVNGVDVDAWDIFNAYIESDPSLRKARGSVVKRNTGRAPWSTQLDLRWAVELPISVARVSLTADVLNLINLIDSDKGIQRYVSFGEVSPVNATVNAAGQITKYTINTNIVGPTGSKGIFTDDVRSRWQAKLGLRIGF